MPLHAILAAIIVALCWGGNYSASKFAILEFTPFSAILLRFVLLTVILAPFALRLGLPNWRDMTALALTNTILHFSLLMVALSLGLNISSVIIAIQLGVPFSCMLAAIFFKDYLGPWRTAGLALAFLGVMMVAGTPNVVAHWGAFMIAVIAAIAWALGNLYLKMMKPTPVVQLLFWPGAMALPGLALIVALIEPGAAQHAAQADWRGWLAIAYSAMFSSLIGYGLWNWLVTNYKLSQVVPYSLLVPVFGIAIGLWLFEESLDWKLLVGGAMTLAGVAIITLRRPKLAKLEQS